MILISHRGNIGGPNKKFENEPEYILWAIKNGFHVEIDVWFLESNGFYLGHDYPKIPININFLKSKYPEQVTIVLGYSDTHEHLLLGCIREPQVPNNVSDATSPTVLIRMAT